jgi:hypothetical protein
LRYAVDSWISRAGVVLATASGITLLWFLAMGSLSVNPYLGILFFFVLPGLFLLGLLLIPLGILLRRRSQRRAGVQEPAAVDLSSPAVRKVLLGLGAATAVNVAILGSAGFKGIEYMDSNTFCGLTCHVPMAPEYAAFRNSPHSRVGCAQCHIGPGAGWFVKSKISGIRQLWTVTFGTYHRPIPSPVAALRPARETCEQCHWPQKFQGDKLFVHTKYGDDEASTPATSVLLLKLGGRTLHGNEGIHGRHLDPGERISYVATDARRMVIPKVIYRGDDGKTVEYFADGARPEDLKNLPVRKMDCIDCHNRPTHAFELPERAVDAAITEGLVSRELPFIRKISVEALKVPYPDQASAAAGIPRALEAYYRRDYPAVLHDHPERVAAAGEAVKAIYLRNVFPDMKLTWGTHPNHLGHDDFPGCWRCHDGSHTSRDGRTINGNCDACHAILAQDEADPPILKQLALR